MQETFRRFVDALEPIYQQLISMEPVALGFLPTWIPGSGIYLFSEGDRYLYVGRSRTLRKRLQLHARDSSGQGQAAFAFRLAREQTGFTDASYQPEGSRHDLELLPRFKVAFAAAKNRIRKMDIRFVEETDPTRQALLEIYVAVSLKTPYNDFDTH